MEHLSTFGLTRDPFANEPQLDLFFESQSARDVAARLRRAAQQGKGLAVLTAAGGLGKTMLVRHVLEGLEEELFEPCLLVPVPGVSDGAWVLDRLARQLGAESPAKERGAVLTEVYEKLAIVREEGRHAVLILDEAQVLGEQGVLRELRGLLNLEYEERRLLTLVLVGLPGLAQAVASEPALAERVDVPLRLAPLTAEESSRYLTHRIRAAGGNPAILESSAVAALVKWGGGVPRVLNRLADAALFEAHLAGRVSATAADVERAAAELELRPPEPSAAFVEPPRPEPATRPEPPALKRAEPPKRVEPPKRAPAPERPLARAAAPTPTPARRAPLEPAITRPVFVAAPAAGELEALFEEADPALELDEVVAAATNPARGTASATVALLGDDDASFDAAFDPISEPDPESDAATALFAEDDLADATSRPEDSSGDLDDLFADLVKDD